MKVYADHAATTPMRPEAKEAMIEALEDFGNPSSIHALGRLASAKMESARKAIAELLNCRPAEVYFTSGGSEADNWAIRAARYGAGDVVAKRLWRDFIGCEINPDYAQMATERIFDTPQGGQCGNNCKNDG